MRSHDNTGLGQNWQRHALILWTATLVLLGLGISPLRADILVFAAASTTEPLREVAAQFTQRSNQRVHLSFASSAHLARQILAGAPADLFLSANGQWMDAVQQDGRVVPGSRHDLLGNRLVLITPLDSPLPEAIPLHDGVDLQPLLGDQRLAIGDPTTVPAGIYGQQALQSLNAYKTIESRLATLPDARAVVALVERGETPLGVAYVTDVHTSPRVRAVAQFPLDSHPPIVYPLALINQSRQPQQARAFYDYLMSPEAAMIFRRSGFLFPQPTPQ